MKFALGAVFLAGRGLKNKPGNAGDFAELAPGKFCGVHAGDEVIE